MRFANTRATTEQTDFTTLANGHSKSITLIPVSKSSILIVHHSLALHGESPKCCLCSTGPASSIGRPKTSMIRPRVPLPTGTEIGAPVLLTGRPRLDLQWNPWR